MKCQEARDPLLGAVRDLYLGSMKKGSRRSVPAGCLECHSAEKRRRAFLWDGCQGIIPRIASMMELLTPYGPCQLHMLLIRSVSRMPENASMKTTPKSPSTFQIE